MESEKSEKSVIGGGRRISGEDTLASDPKVGWGVLSGGRCVRGVSVGAVTLCQSNVLCA